MKLRGLLLAGGALLLCFGGIGSVPLLEPDEGRYAEIPREMLASGDFVTPRLNGVLYFEKPPLYYWLCAASLSVFGGIEWGARFCSALSTVATAGLAYLLGRSLRGPRAGNLAALILLTAPLHFVLAHVNLIDPTLTFFLDATLVSFWLAHRSESARAARALWHAMFAGAAFATLCKGLIGIVIPGAVVFLYLLFTARWATLRRVPWLSGIPLFLAISVPWHVAVAARNPGFLWFYFVREHLLRYATPLAEREQPVWFFAAILVPGLLPWWGLFPAAVGRVSVRMKTLRSRPDLCFLVAWAGFVLVFFSASRSKLIPYVLPAVLPLAVLAALALDEALHRGDLGRIRWGMAVSSVVLAGAGGVLVWLCSTQDEWRSGPLLPLLATLCASVSVAGAIAWARADVRRGLAASVVACALLFGCLLTAVGPHSTGRTARGLATRLRTLLRPGDEVYCYRHYAQTLPPYLGRQVGLVAYAGELEYGISKLSDEERSERFPSPEQLRPRWDSDRTVYLITEEMDLSLLEREGLHPGRVLFREGKLLLLANR